MDEQQLNGYGDRRVAAAGGYGVDVASQRFDDLDDAALDFVAAFQGGPKPIVLELGPGRGALAAAMARGGALVTAVDVEPTEITGVTVIHGDVAQIDRLLPAAFLFDALVSQRMIHYLPYDVAGAVLRQLRARVVPGGRLFLSASGLRSELGDGYAEAHLPAGVRFGYLAPVMAERHNIRMPVCLYDEGDMTALLRAAGWSPLHIYRSTFGNIKAIARG